MLRQQNEGRPNQYFEVGVKGRFVFQLKSRKTGWQPKNVQINNDGMDDIDDYFDDSFEQQSVVVQQQQQISRQRQGTSTRTTSSFPIQQHTTIHRVSPGYFAKQQSSEIYYDENGPYEIVEEQPQQIVEQIEYQQPFIARPSPLRNTVVYRNSPQQQIVASSNLSRTPIQPIRIQGRNTPMSSVRRIVYEEEQQQAIRQSPHRPVRYTGPVTQEFYPENEVVEYEEVQQIQDEYGNQYLQPTRTVSRPMVEYVEEIPVQQQQQQQQQIVIAPMEDSIPLRRRLGTRLLPSSRKLSAVWDEPENSYQQSDQPQGHIVKHTPRQLSKSNVVATPTPQSRNATPNSFSNTRSKFTTPKTISKTPSKEKSKLSNTVLKENVRADKKSTLKKRGRPKKDLFVLRDKDSKVTESDSSEEENMKEVKIMQHFKFAQKEKKWDDNAESMESSALEEASQLVPLKKKVKKSINTPNGNSKKTKLKKAKSVKPVQDSVTEDESTEENIQSHEVQKEAKKGMKQKKVKAADDKEYLSPETENNKNKDTSFVNASPNQSISLENKQQNAEDFEAIVLAKEETQSEIDIQPKEQPSTKPSHFEEETKAPEKEFMTNQDSDYPDNSTLHDQSPEIGLDENQDKPEVVTSEGEDNGMDFSQFPLFETDFSSDIPVNIHKNEKPLIGKTKNSTSRDLSPELSSEVNVPNEKKGAKKSKKAYTKAKTQPATKRVKQELQSVIVPIVHKRQNPEEDDGTRKSKRNKIAPLAWWKNEKVVYARRESGVQPIKTSIQEVIRMPSDDESSFPRSRIKSKPKIKREIIPPAPQSFSVVNFLTKKEEVQRVAVTPDMLKIAKPRAGSDYRYHKVFSEGDFLASGVLELPKGAKKPTKNSHASAMIFFVVNGIVQVQVHNTTFVIGEKGQFFVPRGNTYSIQNIGAKDCSLFFCHGKDLSLNK